MVFLPYLIFRTESNGHWREGENARIARSGGQVSLAEGKTDVVKLEGIIQGQVRRPLLVGVDELDIDLGDILTFVDQLGLVSLLHVAFLVRKSVLTRDPAI